MFKVNTRPRHRNAGRPAYKSAPGYLKWLRTRECILAPTGECKGKVRACHWDEAGDKGVATKVSDKFALPMCDEHHRIQTEVAGWPHFQTQYGFKAGDVCAAFWGAWHGRAAWEAVNGR